MPESIVILKPNVAKDDLDEADLALINSTGATVETHDVFIGFDNRPVEWLLAQYMPHIENITSSFEHVGHIAHMNLRDEMLDAKYLIGAIVLLVRLISLFDGLGSSSTLLILIHVLLLCRNTVMQVSKQW